MKNNVATAISDSPQTLHTEEIKFNESTTNVTAQPEKKELPKHFEIDINLEDEQNITAPKKKSCCSFLSAYHDVSKNGLALEKYPTFMTHTLITSRAILNNPKAADLLTDDLQRQRVTQASLTASKFYARHETAIDITRITLLIYMFLVSLSVIGNSAKAIGARSFTEFFAFADDPAMAIAVGLATTVAFQSSSTVTSLITTLVGAGVFSKNIAQYMVFGANLGTTVTNGLVSLLWSCKMNKEEFANRFSKATVHDIFNIWSLIFGVTLQASCRFFNWTTEAMTKHLTNGDNNDRGEKVNFLKLITGPLSKLILSVDKNAMKSIAKDPNSKTCFKTIIKQGIFSGMIWTDEGKGLATLAVSIAALSYSLYKITRITDKMIHQLHDSHNANPQASCITKLDQAYKKVTEGCKNSNPAVTNYCKGYATILASVGFTILAQSSSVTTSLYTILLFERKIDDKAFLEAVIGANIGTVFSSVMAAWSAKTHAKDAFQVAFTHLLFNLIGLAILYPIPKIRDFTLTQPTKYIEKLLNKSKAFGPLYLFSLYIALPALVLLIGHASQNNVAHSNNGIFNNSTSNNSSITFNDPELFNCSTLKL